MVVCCLMGFPHGSYMVKDCLPALILVPIPAL